MFLLGFIYFISAHCVRLISCWSIFFMEVTSCRVVKKTIYSFDFAHRPSTTSDTCFAWIRMSFCMLIANRIEPVFCSFYDGIATKNLFLATFLPPLNRGTRLTRNHFAFMLHSRQIGTSVCNSDTSVD